LLVKVFTKSLQGLRGRGAEPHIGKKVVGKAFLFLKRILAEFRGFFYEIAKSLKFTAEHTENAKAPETT